MFGRICYRQMQSLFGDAGASTVQTLLSSAAHMGKSRVAIHIGVVTLLIDASTVFVEPLKLARLGLGTRVDKKPGELTTIKSTPTHRLRALDQVV